MEQVYAVLNEHNVVVNVIVADQSFVDAHYPGSPVVTADAGIGFTYDSEKGAFTAPLEP